MMREEHFPAGKTTYAETWLHAWTKGVGWCGEYREKGGLWGEGPGNMAI